MDNDIIKRKGFAKYFELYIEPRRLELAEIMGTLKKIEITEPRVHTPELRASFNGQVLCYCNDCYGDFTSASEDN